MERLDHLRPGFGERDWKWDSHLAEQEAEDYEFMIRTGSTHEQALDRLGMKHDTWERRKGRAS